MRADGRREMSSANAERETVSCSNEEDSAEWFFTLWTSVPSVFRRLCRRIGGRNKLTACLAGIRDSREASWDCQVSIEFLNLATFAIGKRRQKQLSMGQKR